MKKPAVLMTDPGHFEIKGGANPHTRLSGNQLKSVDKELARKQWNAYVDALLDHGIDVYIVQATADATGMVFAANAGFLHRPVSDVSPRHQVFYPSHFAVAHRESERPLFETFMASFGIPIGAYDESLFFEGEADAFPIGEGSASHWIFTYGFRTSVEIAPWLFKAVINKPYYQLRLTNPSYYHGDTLLCNLGKQFMVWPGGLDASDFARLKGDLSDRMIVLDDIDAGHFIGNSFYVHDGSERLLFAPHSIRKSTSAKIEECGVHVVPVDISEFFGKGGGGPKCMVFNLGEVDMDDKSLTDAQREFRRAHHITQYRRSVGV